MQGVPGHSPGVNRLTIAAGLSAALLACAAYPSTAQRTAEPEVRTIAPDSSVAAGAVRRALLGADYRALWATPIRIRELDLATFAGGLRPTRGDGGMEAHALRLAAPSGAAYSFRALSKDHSWSYATKFKGSIVEWLSRDQRATGNPASALVATPLLAAAGVLHPAALLVVIPQRADLGDVGAEIAGKPGLLEEDPRAADASAGFAGASEIIGSGDLLKRINADPTQHADAPAFLAARLMDILLGDWDRDPMHWTWARMRGGAEPGAVWVPITRARDMAFVTYEGLIGKIGGIISPASAPFDGGMNVAGLTGNAIDMDRRLLGGLSRATWDSVVTALARRVTDSVVDAAVRALPVELAFSAPRLAATIKQRRAGLAAAAGRFYAVVFAYVDLHATDDADVAAITRVDDRFVDIRLSSRTTGEYFFRRYDAGETREVRVYLHGGNDSAMVTGHVAHSLRVRLIGGNGINSLIDSSTVASNRHWTSIYDVGRVDTVDYGADTLFNRRPWAMGRGAPQPADRDYGTAFAPVFGYSDPRGLGPVPRAGFVRTWFGFEHHPYDTQFSASAEYAFENHGWRIGAAYDHRLESTALHFAANARMSQLEVINYYGLGNATVDSGPRSHYFNARQQQWMFRPAVAVAVSPSSDFSLGPIIQYSTTDRTPGQFISAAPPYGSGDFGEAGLQLILHHDFRDRSVDSPHRFQYDIVGSYFPGVWDVKSPFVKLSATVVSMIPFDLPTQPIVVLRAGGTQLWGAFPFFEAAFLGGEPTVRYMESQRYAGDGALFATSEVRVHVVSFRFLPVDVGLVAEAEAGRVFVNGNSPDGWHTAVGGGVWIGIKDSPSVMTFTLTNERGRPGVQIKSGLGF